MHNRAVLGLQYEIMIPEPYDEPFPSSSFCCVCDQACIPYMICYAPAVRGGEEIKFPRRCTNGAAGAAVAQSRENRVSELGKKKQPQGLLLEVFRRKCELSCWSQPVFASNACEVFTLQV